MDEAGMEVLLVTLSVTNRANTVIRVLGNEHRVEARISTTGLSCVTACGCPAHSGGTGRTKN